MDPGFWDDLLLDDEVPLHAAGAAEAGAGPPEAAWDLEDDAEAVQTPGDEAPPAAAAVPEPPLPFAFELAPEDVVARIDGVLLGLLNDLARGELPQLAPAIKMSATSARTTVKCTRALVVLDVVQELTLSGRLTRQSPRQL